VNIIGIRKEEKAFETRVPLIPKHVEKLIQNHQLEFILEPSNQRAFSTEEYENIGVKIKSLKKSKATVIIGIKEMPTDFFEKNKLYVFFSHTIKGQKHNMPMLKQIINTGASLLDYEKIIDEKNRRLVFFGNWAGMAGISDTFRILGKRLELEGLKPNPFKEMKPTLKLKGVSGLENEFYKLGERIKEQGLPKKLTPFIIGFAGYGNVSRGAQKIFDLLPHISINPEDLSKVPINNHVLYKCVFKEEHMVESRDTSSQFQLNDYYEHGSAKYRGIFHKHIPYLTVLLNCIYWTKKYPRLVTKQFIRSHWNEEKRKLRIIGDISVDMEGAIEFTTITTTPEKPAFTYIIAEDRPEIGIEGNGPVVIAVDNLPCELPRESSTSFSETLLQFVPTLSQTDFTVPFDQLILPKELKDAIIVYQGELVKNYEYLTQYLPN
jgi:saccharopine dehydrogenase (NAD+, L-lysine-forming)